MKDGPARRGRRPSRRPARAGRRSRFRRESDPSRRDSSRRPPLRRDHIRSTNLSDGSARSALGSFKPHRTHEEEATHLRQRRQQPARRSLRDRRNPRRGHVLLPRLRLPALDAGDRRASRLPPLRRLGVPPRLDLRVAPGPLHHQRIHRPRHPRAAELARAGTRAARSSSGFCLAFQDDDGEIVSFPLECGWTRIGRSPNADLRLDDPSVSRRHALIVAETGQAAARPRRPQPQRRLPQRRDGRVRAAERRRRAGDRPLQPLRAEALSPRFRPPPSLGLPL